MDLSDLGRRGTADAGAATSPSNAASNAHTAERLQALLAQVGAEIACPLTFALERLNTLASTGRIERQSLRDLQAEVEAARRAGMVCQQLTRFTAGRIRQSHEALGLGASVEHLLAHRHRETEARGVTVHLARDPVQVVVDASLLFGLLSSTLDWALANRALRIDIAVEPRPAPLLARLVWRFTPQPADATTEVPNPSAAADASTASPPASFDSLTWRLIEETARAMGLQTDRARDAGVCRLAFDFSRPARADRGRDSTLDANQGFAASMNSQPLAGSHLLVIASRREMRVRIRDALSRMSLILDFVNTVDEAAAFCREGLPHAIVIEAIQSGERFARLRRDICTDLPEFVFIEIVEEGREFQMSSPGGVPARIGREVMTDSLPAALVFELSKSL